MDNPRRQFDSIGTRPVQPRPVQASPLATPQPTPPPPPPVRAAVSQTAQPKPRRKRRVVKFVGFVIVLALVAGGVVLAQQSLNKPPAVTVDPDNTEIPAANQVSSKDKVMAQETKDLQALLDKLVKNADAPVYISVRDLKSGAEATNGGSKSITSASLYKLFVANQIYRQIDAGTLSGSKVLPRGKTITQCLSPMIIVSDNACGAQLGDLLGWGDQDADLHKQGYTGTSLDDLPSTNSNDVSLLFARLYRGNLLSTESNAAFLKLLKAQEINNRLPTGLPDNTVIAHKTGDLYGYVHDAGIVYGTKTDYAIAVMSGEWPYPAYAADYFTTISKEVWNLLEN